MKIINKIREWNILVKILLFLISLPLIWFIEDFIGGMIVFIMFYIGGVPVKPNLMGFLLLVEIIVVIISWISSSVFFSPVSLFSHFSHLVINHHSIVKHFWRPLFILLLFVLCLW